MNIKQFFKRSFTWEWRTPILLVIALVPAVLIALLYKADAGIAAIIGLIPAAFAGVAPKRKHRAYVLMLGLVLSLSLLLGSMIKMYCNMASAAIIMAALGIGAVLLAGRFRSAQIGVGMAAPLVAIGLSYSTYNIPAEILIVMVAGSALTFLVSLLFPEYTPSPGKAPSAPPPPTAPDASFAPDQKAKAPPTPLIPTKIYSLLYGAALATATLVGYSWDHTGWVVGSTAFVMRPSKRMEEFRSIWRIVSIFLGAGLASAVLSAQPSTLVAVLLAGLALLLAGGLRLSAGYIMPAFMTYIVFTLILFPVTDEGTVLYRFRERVAWVAVGILVACIFDLLLPWLYLKVILPHRKKHARR